MAGILYVSACDDGQIYSYRSASGKMTLLDRTDEPGGPRAILFSSDGRRMFLSTQDAHLVQYDVQPGGALAERARIGVPFRYTHIAFARQERAVIGASYNGGCVGLHGIGPEGTLEDRPGNICHTDHAAHYILFGESEDNFYVPHPDVRKLFKLRVSPEGLEVLGWKPLASDVRHFKGNANGIYGIAYLDNQISRWRETDGWLSLEARASMLPEGFSRFSSGSEIRLHPRLPLLYAANRGADCLTVARTSDLRALAFFPVDPEPTCFCLDTDGRTLFTAGKYSGTLRIDRLSEDGTRILERRTLPVGNGVMWMEYLGENDA